MAVWRGIRFWAERGMVRCEDAKDNSYRVNSVRSGGHRVQALNDMVKASTGFIRQYHDLIVEHQNFIEDYLDVLRVAREQGMPDDPSAVRAAVRSLPTTVRVLKDVPSFPL
jgi:hypothetical protein